MSKITVLGSGGWGLALSISLFSTGNELYVWSVFPDEIEQLKKNRETHLLKGVKIPEEINLVTSLDCVKDSDIVIFAVPSFAIRETAKKIKDIVNPNTIIVNVAKGIENSTLMSLADVIEEEIPSHKIVVLSGPSHAEEVARGMATSLVAASIDKEAAMLVQDAFISPSLRVYINDDVIGVELGGAFKNIIALAAGVCDGLGLGDNVKAALMTRGLSEIAELGVAMGAQERTFAGLTGLGDLIVTCTSKHSRNRRFGALVGGGMTPDEALKEVGMTVEGYHATKTAVMLAKKFNVEMPITNECYNVLYNNAPVKSVLQNLMERPKKNEYENMWL
ncbi:MAG: NAD(P)-dependent glycerol-3-phosphate dehydrogenase [Clostridia bacterium]|nr:NAD(P)-dependent glycerol-3-phosphate dehydrogenase [Clostridia bacterium]